MEEQIEMSELANNDGKEYRLDDWKSIKVIQTEQIGFDAEKGFCDYQVVFKRLSDGKLFMFEYTQFGYNGDDILEQTAIEVEAKQKTITYYE